MRSFSIISFPFSVKCIVLSVLLMQLSFEAHSIEAASTSSGNETDHVALLEFKAKITHDPQHVMSSWNDSVHFCNWEGITCGRRHKRVTILDLHSKGLVGSLSAYIGNMSFLREIRLYNNSLQGEIPQDLGHLSRLKVLFLANNTFEGQIPSNLSRCSNLISLGMGYNQLTGKIPVELATLLKLEVLSIHYNYLSGGIPSFLGNLSSLEILSAAYNLLSRSIPDALGQLKYLSFIGLAANNLSEYGLGSEPSTSGDVYSYGILLLEMITRKKPMDEVFVEGLNLHNFVKMALQSKVLEIVDPILLQEDCKIECVISMIKIGIACSVESPQDRMDISNTVNELTSIRNNYVRAITRPSVHTSN